MKKTIALLLSVLTVIGIVSIGFSPIHIHAHAEDSCSENGFKYVVEDGFAQITKFPDESENGELIVPETLGGYPVRVISSSAYNVSKYSSVYIPASIEEISLRTFSYGSLLEKIIVDPKNKVYCSDENGVLFSKDMSELVAYPRNKKDATYKIPESVHSIALYAFDDNNNLTEMIIPGNVKKIGQYAFYDASSLSKVVFENGVEDIGHFSFYGTLISELSIPESVEKIGAGAFEGTPFTENNSNYDSDGVLYLDNTVISTLKGSLKTYEIKDGTRLIAGQAFGDFGTLDEIIIPASVQYLSSSPFYAKKITVSDDSAYLCVGEHGILYSKDKTQLIRFPSESDLVCYTIPEGVKVISGNAIQSDVLNNLYIPDSVEFIDVFGFPSGDIVINYQGTKEQWDEMIFGIDEYNKRWLMQLDGKTVNYNTYSYEEHATLSYSKTEPNCTEIGETSWECLCGESGYIVYPPKGHTPKNQHGSDKEYGPTCFKEGFYASTCINCGELFNIKPIPKLDHSNSQFVIESVKPTCTKDGYDVIRCHHTSCYEKNTVYYEKLGHAPIPGVSYTKDGITYSQCSRCDEFYIPEEEHIHTNEWIYTPGKSCTASGTETLTCTECGFISDTRVAVPQGHDYNVYITGETCTSVTKYYYCKSCGDKYYSTTIREGVHGKLETVIIEPSCSIVARGQKYERCTVCGARVSDITYIPSTGHTFTEEIIKDATDSEEGIKRLTCTKCSYSKEETIPISSDAYKVEWIVDGNVEIVTAIKVGDKIKAPENPQKEGYEFVGWTPSIPDVMPAENIVFNAIFNKISKAENFDVSATYAPEAFSEPVSLDVNEVQGDREPGGVYMVEGAYYEQIGLYNIKAVNDSLAVVQPNEGYKVTIKLALPDAYKNRTAFVIYHRFVGGGREQLSTAAGTVKVEDGYLIFEVESFSEFEVMAVAPSIKITRLPIKTVYTYGEEIDLTGIRVIYTKADGTETVVTRTEYLTVSGFDSTKTGKQIVTVGYGQYRDTFEVEVKLSFWQWIIRIFFFGFIKF